MKLISLISGFGQENIIILLNNTLPINYVISYNIYLLLYIEKYFLHDIAEFFHTVYTHIVPKAYKIYVYSNKFIVSHTKYISYTERKYMYNIFVNEIK